MYRIRKYPWAIVGLIGAVAILIFHGVHHSSTPVKPAGTTVPGTAVAALSKLVVRADTSMSGYSRAQYGPAWADVDKNSCDTRDDVLARDLRHITRQGSCTVLSGTLADPYTGQSIQFHRGVKTSSLVQIDHVTPLGSAWVTGAKNWTAAKREQYANDPLNLLAVDSHSNEQKGDKDASQWLPPAKSFDCEYIAIQITVKIKYSLSVSPAEHDAMAKVLQGCPDQGVEHP